MIYKMSAIDKSQKSYRRPVRECFFVDWRLLLISDKGRKPLYEVAEYIKKRFPRIIFIKTADMHGIKFEKYKKYFVIFHTYGGITSPENYWEHLQQNGLENQIFICPVKEQLPTTIMTEDDLLLRVSEYFVNKEKSENLEMITDFVKLTNFGNKWQFASVFQNQYLFQYLLEYLFDQCEFIL